MSSATQAFRQSSQDDTQPWTQPEMELSLGLVGDPLQHMWQHSLTAGINVRKRPDLLLVQKSILGTKAVPYHRVIPRKEGLPGTLTRLIQPEGFFALSYCLLLGGSGLSVSFSTWL